MTRDSCLQYRDSIQVEAHCFLVSHACHLQLSRSQKCRRVHASVHAYLILEHGAYCNSMLCIQVSWSGDGVDYVTIVVNITDTADYWSVDLPQRAGMLAQTVCYSTADACAFAPGMLAPCRNFANEPSVLTTAAGVL